MANTKSSNAYQYYAFISYSAEDKAFAEKLEKALENYKPPKDLNLPQRHLNVFRYETDMTGTEYYESIQKHLTQIERFWRDMSFGCGLLPPLRCEEA